MSPARRWRRRTFPWGPGSVTGADTPHQKSLCSGFFPLSGKTEGPREPPASLGEPPRAPAAERDPGAKPFASEVPELPSLTATPCSAAGSHAGAQWVPGWGPAGSQPGAPPVTVLWEHLARGERNG